MSGPGQLRRGRRRRQLLDLQTIIVNNNIQKITSLIRQPLLLKDRLCSLGNNNKRLLLQSRRKKPKIKVGHAARLGSQRFKIIHSTSDRTQLTDDVTENKKGKKYLLVSIRVGLEGHPRGCGRVELVERLLREYAVVIWNEKKCDGS